MVTLRRNLLAWFFSSCLHMAYPYGSINIDNLTVLKWKEKALI